MYVDASLFACSITGVLDVNEFLADAEILLNPLVDAPPGEIEVTEIAVPGMLNINLPLAATVGATRISGTLTKINAPFAELI